MFQNVFYLGKTKGNLLFGILVNILGVLIDKYITLISYKL